MDAVRHEQSQKRVRVYVDGVKVADSLRPQLVWEVPYYPSYYLPIEDVRTDLLVPTATVSTSPTLGPARHFTVKAGGAERVDAARQYVDAPVEVLRDSVRFDWNAMDGWFEEDEEVHTHPRDPYKRIDILATSREVAVGLGGVELARSANARVLFETSLPPRWYVPKVHVRMDLLVPSSTASHCPYKGQAEYWSVPVAGRMVENVAWSYRAPFPESQKIAGLVAFFNERVDLWIDGVLEERPHTPFS